MNAFIEAIKRIDEVNIDEQYKETFCNVMKQFAKFFENNNIELDVEQIFESKLYTGLEISQIEKDLIANGVKADGCFYLEDNAIALPPLNSGYDKEHILAHEFTHFLIMNTSQTSRLGK